jgi:hypothetical protein
MLRLDFYLYTHILIYTFPSATAQPAPCSQVTVAFSVQLEKRYMDAAIQNVPEAKSPWFQEKPRVCTEAGVGT